MIMKTKYFAGLCLVAALASCTGKEKTAEQAEATDAQATATVDVNGQWTIEQIVLNDTTNIFPAKEVADEEQYIEFTDSTYYIHTNCNSISGFCAVNGDSIQFQAGAMTRMACPNMVTEDALCQILPNLVKIEAENDSTLKITGSNENEYILLGKAKAEVAE